MQVRCGAPPLGLQGLCGLPRFRNLLEHRTKRVPSDGRHSKNKAPSASARIRPPHRQAAYPNDFTGYAMPQNELECRRRQCRQECSLRIGRQGMQSAHRQARMQSAHRPQGMQSAHRPPGQYYSQSALPMRPANPTERGHSRISASHERQAAAGSGVRPSASATIIPPSRAPP